MSGILSLEGNPYYKELDVDSILHNPYTWDVVRFLSWKDNAVKVNIYAAYRFVNPAKNVHYISVSEQLMLAEWRIKDFVIYSKVIRDSRHIFLQVSPYTRKYLYPFGLEAYKKNKPDIEKERLTDKEERLNREDSLKGKRCNPFCSGAQKH